MPSIDVVSVADTHTEQTDATDYTIERTWHPSETRSNKTICLRDDYDKQYKIGYYYENLAHPVFWKDGMQINLVEVPSEEVIIVDAKFS